MLRLVPGIDGTAAGNRVASWDGVPVATFPWCSETELLIADSLLMFKTNFRSSLFMSSLVRDGSAGIGAADDCWDDDKAPITLLRA